MNTKTAPRMFLLRVYVDYTRMGRGGGGETGLQVEKVHHKAFLLPYPNIHSR